MVKMMLENEVDRIKYEQNKDQLLFEKKEQQKADHNLSVSQVTMHVMEH